MHSYIVGGWKQRAYFYIYIFLQCLAQVMGQTQGELKTLLRHQHEERNSFKLWVYFTYLYVWSKHIK